MKCTKINRQNGKGKSCYYSTQIKSDSNSNLLTQFSEIEYILWSSEVSVLPYENKVRAFIFCGWPSYDVTNDSSSHEKVSSESDAFNRWYLEPKVSGNPAHVLTTHSYLFWCLIVPNWTYWSFDSFRKSGGLKVSRSQQQIQFQANIHPNPAGAKNDERKSKTRHSMVGTQLPWLGFFTKLRL